MFQQFLVTLSFFVSKSLADIQQNSSDPRIVGGNQVDIECFPYQVSFQDNQNRHFCGGSIISPTYILSAAHCFQNALAGALKVRVGSSSVGGNEGKIYQVSKITNHPKYNFETYDFDFSIVQLSSPISYSNKVQPVSLPENEEPEVEGTECIVSGWGLTNNPNESNKHLRAVMVPIVNRKTCNDKFKDLEDGSYEVTENMLCAGYLEGGRDACQGDSGGPLITKTDNGPKLIGIVSWGYQCAAPDYPGVYSKVSMVRSWIKGNAGV
ncbi:trypsin-4-like [Culicoides brevitarsis]|uniref:trypsin-4-like n=1 Tax=Culicoides brevitarsis TaxID=469753 RepID=UPI00307C523A